MAKPLILSNAMFPTPARAEFYAWMLERFDLPAGTPLTRGFFESARVLKLPYPWTWRHLAWQFSFVCAGDQQNQQWRRKLNEKLRSDEDAASWPELWRRDPISAEGWIVLLCKLIRLPNDAPPRRFLRYFGDAEGALTSAELLLRRDIEIRGRAYVAAKGAQFYLAPAQNHASLTAHQALETALRWRELGLFEPRDAEFCARFPQTLDEHQKWLHNKRSGQRANLCGRDLREVSWPKGALRGADLRGAILRSVNLQGDDLRGCDLRWADLTAANLKDCRLTWAKLHEALLDFALMPMGDPFWAYWTSNHKTEWLGVIDDGQGVWHNPAYRRRLRKDLSGCDLRGRVLSFIANGQSEIFDFSDCDLRGADFSRGGFGGLYSQTRFNGADLRGAGVWGANFNGCDFEGADLRDLIDADRAQWDANPPRERDWRGVNWPGALMRGRNFAGCDFSGANLRGAYLSQANFAGAILRDADLRGANLEMTQLKGADLRGARVSRKALQKAKFE